MFFKIFLLCFLAVAAARKLSKRLRKFILFIFDVDFRLNFKHAPSNIFYWHLTLANVFFGIESEAKLADFFIHYYIVIYMYI